MIVRRESTIINYHRPFDQALTLASSRMHEYYIQQKQTASAPELSDLLGKATLQWPCSSPGASLKHHQTTITPIHNYPDHHLHHHKELHWGTYMYRTISSAPLLLPPPTRIHLPYTEPLQTVPPLTKLLKHIGTRNTTSTCTTTTTRS